MRLTFKWPVRSSLLGTLLLLILGCGEMPVGENGPSQDSNSASSESSESGKVWFVGFDASPPLLNALESGQIQGLVIQNPFKMGELGVKSLVEQLEGKAVERQISTGELLATPENMSDPEVAARLNPPKVPNVVDSGLGGPKRKKYRVMVVPKGTTHVHWQAVHAGAKQAADELGNVEIVWLGPTKEDDRAAQIALVEQAIAAKVDGLVLAPLDSQALVRPVEEAIDSGIPVVIIDSGLESDKPTSYVATDNYHGGVLAGERLASLMEEKGRVILLRYAPNSDATVQREKGFTDTIAKYPGITFLSENRYAGATADSAQQEAQRLVLQFRGQVDGIFCPNESSTAGMLRALSDAGMLRTAK